MRAEEKLERGDSFGFPEDKARRGDFSEKGRAAATLAEEAARAALATAVAVPTPIFALHQSMNGLPRCGVPMVVRDSGV